MDKTSSSFGGDVGHQADDQIAQNRGYNLRISFQTLNSFPRSRVGSKMSAMFRTFSSGLILAALSLPLIAQTSSPANHKILVSDVTISGVRSLSTDDMEIITSTLTGKIIDDNEEEIAERLKFAFQDSGYFASKIDAVRVRTSDALANPRPVIIEAVATEGPRFKIRDLRFTGNHAISTKELKSQFPIKKGELFNRSKIGSGLDALRTLYAKLGYIDFTPLPNSEVADDSIDLNIDIDEGRQYRLGAIEFTGNASLAEKLRPRWHLEFGQPFDAMYVEKFLNENQSLLPLTFDAEHAASVGRNCPNSTVILLIDLDPEHPTERRPEDVPCEKDKK
jgi:outer membrane protein assembly factor BamA